MAWYCFVLCNEWMPNSCDNYFSFHLNVSINFSLNRSVSNWFSKVKGLTKAEINQTTKRCNRGLTSENNIGKISFAFSCSNWECCNNNWILIYLLKADSVGSFRNTVTVWRHYSTAVFVLSSGYHLSWCISWLVVFLNSLSSFVFKVLFW